MQHPRRQSEVHCAMKDLRPVTTSPLLDSSLAYYSVILNKQRADKYHIIKRFFDEYIVAKANTYLSGNVIGLGAI